MELYERTISEKLIHKGDYLTYVNIEVELPNGKSGSRDVIKHPGAAAIIALLDDNRVILVRQFRKACEKILLEIPAGKLNGNEDTKKCAIRELEEETGYIAGEVTYLGTVAPAPGFCDELIYIYKATALVKGDKKLDEDEFTEVELFTIDEIKDMIKNGDIIDSKTICSIMYL